MYRFPSIAAAVVLCLSATSAMAQSSWMDDWKKGHSEAWIGQDAGQQHVDYLKKQYGLKDGFTEDDLRAAAANTGVKHLRTYYHLGPDFTAASFATAAGAGYATDLFKTYPMLQPHFTMRQLAEQRALNHLSGYDGFTEPFSFEEYARAKGRTEAADLVKNGLPPNFTYQDLIRVQGQEDAASTRARFGFSKQATHDEIVAAMGLHRARQFVSYHDGLKEGFSAAELQASLTNEELAWIKRDDGLDATATEEDYVALKGQHELNYLLGKFNEQGAPQRLSATFTEKDYAAAEGDFEVTEERNRYDLNPGFTESDLYNAASGSAQAHERQHYHLMPGFTAAEDGSARQSCTPSYLDFGSGCRN
jgi:hypothetical protein